MFALWFICVHTELINLIHAGFVQIAALAPIHVLTPEGTLYVKVVEARNLPDIEPGKTVSPYTELYIVAALNQPQRTSVLKTEVYEHSSNPKASFPFELYEEETNALMVHHPFSGLRKCCSPS